MRWIAYFILFVIPKCGQTETTVLLPPNEHLVPEATTVCEKALSCNLIEFEKLNKCIICMLKFFDETEDSLSKEVITGILTEMSCEDIKETGTQYLIFQCIL